MNFWKWEDCVIVIERQPVPVLNWRHFLNSEGCFRTLSQKTNISQSSLSNLMKRGSTPTFYTLERICEGLGITLAQFFSIESEKPDLTAEQKKVLATWDSLSDQEKKAVEIYVRGMKLE